jgi:cyclic beta-1,2-glucan synthetase
MLGQGANRAESSALIKRYQNPAQTQDSFVDLQTFWREKLNSVQVKTPDPAFDLMINRWLIYQTMSSRMMARAGFYQASGAFGFRDQLQDSLALLQVDPQRVRRHILLAAEHQFEQGDVQHWWHPPSGRGVKTRCSDDYLWLVYVTAHYIEATGDTAILSCTIPFLIAPGLHENEHDRYARFDSGNPATLLEHCCRALSYMMRTGARGLPLIEAGDWNDGMDRIGIEGRGESVWLAWFQIATVNAFSPLAVQCGLADRAAHWQRHAQRLKEAIDSSAWDGHWYVRAFDDNGNPWGSHRNEECQIDSIAQSWGVLAGFGHQEDVQTAMASARDKLVDEHGRLILLLDPPFHDSPRDPGYIQAYPPGIRENGGQYSHAASWLGLAFAELGDGDMAWRVFDILNPIRRITNAAEAMRYEREPYVLAGDVSSQRANKGRGGWTWYTGAAGWTWQLGVTGILGLRAQDGAFVIDPNLPKEWGGAELTIKRPDGVIRVIIEDPEHLGHGVQSLTVNGESVRENLIGFPGKGEEITVLVRLGLAQSELADSAC